MSEDQQQGEQIQDGEQFQDGEHYVVPGSDEYEAMADYMGVIEEYPELGSDPAAAQAALATASGLASLFERPDLATHPGVIATAHRANMAERGEEDASVAESPPDPVDAIIRGGRGGVGGKVLDF